MLPALAPAPTQLSVGAPSWLATWAREAEHAQRAKNRRAACAALVSIGNRLHVDEQLAREDRRTVQARTENLRELCPYLDEGGS
jgi:predicted TPR repeat methyltransferase